MARPIEGYFAGYLSPPATDRRIFERQGATDRRIFWRKTLSDPRPIEGYFGGSYPHPRPIVGYSACPRKGTACGVRISPKGRKPCLCDNRISGVIPARPSSEAGQITGDDRLYPRPVVGYLRVFCGPPASFIPLAYSSPSVWELSTPRSSAFWVISFCRKLAFFI
jgi:hypothetical protein